MTLYARLAGVANAALKPLGYRVVRRPGPALRCRLKAMEAAAIDLVLDVGANTGQYAAELRAHGYAGRIQSFEPLPDAFAALAAASAGDPCWDVLNVAAGAEPGRLPLHVAGNSVASSLLAVTETTVGAAPGSRAERTVEVEVVTLDGPIGRGAGARMLLKLDVQGYEWQALAGCGAALDRVAMLDVEMSLTPLYAGQALFPEVDGFLRGRGFRAIGFDTGFWDPGSGQLLQLDGIYVREDLVRRK